ncbi:hypothetical protein GGH96_002109 [Coemansia sp. RSA 1972]|nr:hypothetical protein GGH96_002109 [Coemansia sp. RSA 1972]
MRNISSDVVRLIAQTAAGQDAFGQEPVHIRALLSVCQLWRTASLSVYCSCITVCMPADRIALYWARKGLSATKARALGWHIFARQAVVIVSGRQPNVPYDAITALNSVFRRVTCVKLHATTNPGPVFSALLVAFPALRQIKLEATNTQISRTMHAPTSLTHMEVTSCPAFAVCATIPCLRSLVLNMAGTHTNALAFARQHARTLVKLVVKHIHVRDCPMLVLDEHNKCVEYVHVQVLRLDVLGAYNPELVAQRAHVQGTPFPSLQYLNCGSLYPFANNILLRGAHRTLRVLIISIDTTVAAWLLPEATCLRKYTRLAGMEARIVSRADVGNTQNIAIHARVLDAAFQSPHMQWLRIKYPNSHTAEYSSKHKIKL